MSVKFSDQMTVVSYPLTDEELESKRRQMERVRKNANEYYDHYNYVDFLHSEIKRYQKHENYIQIYYTYVEMRDYIRKHDIIYIKEDIL